MFCFVTSGLGVLAYPKPAKAVLPAIDLMEIINKVILIVWKTVIFPLLKKIILSVITKGDFPITLDAFKEWLYKDLGFQILEAILNQYGLTLCSRFSANIKLAIQKHLAAEWAPTCTWDESWLAKTLEDCLRTGEEACWAKIRADALKSVRLTFSGSNNEFFKWFDVQDTFYSRKAKEEGDLRLEIQANSGFLGKRDCSKWKKETHDFNGDGKMQENECPLMTAGESIAKMIEPYGPMQDSSMKSVIWSDMVSLLAQIIDTLLSDAVGGMVNKINTWKSNQQRKAATEYQEAKTQQKMGQNKPLEVPAEAR